MSGQTTRESDKFMLRLPDGMRDRIKAAADASGRSMNAEIVATLEEKYPAPAESDFHGDWRVVHGYMDLVESAKDDAERTRYLEIVNAAMRNDPAFSGFEIRVMKDFEGDHFAAFISKSKPK